MPENPYSQILFSAGCDSGVVRHCEVVASVASRFSGDSVDSELVRAGSMMHDIGRSVTHDISHAQEGARICCERGEREVLTEIVRRHTGAGLDADECTLLGLSPMDCVPQTLEEKIVAHADNLVKGSTVISIEERMMRIADLSGRSKKKIWRLAMEVELLG
ncbi:MAG: HDIG domain-containing protein [Methanocorpusculum sp.]|nr:HDIG domain-containing protein [Methanocorpusculum sp.]MDE2518911.1 HDIG domain-containing protein [Methanocorpusculum sp.]MDE2521945.1 HDIG domain-containing protein [Methanocorpusculum sp.]MDE2525487.1 HDIG domain-containing protein [Methanocorpusculum sp.]